MQNGWRYLLCVLCRRIWRRATSKLCAALSSWPPPARSPGWNTFSLRTPLFTLPTANFFAIVCALRALSATSRSTASEKRSFLQRRQRHCVSNRPRSSAASLDSANPLVHRGVRTKSSPRSAPGSPWHARQLTRFGGFRRLQPISARGAILVAFRHFALALRARWVQVALAVGAKVEPRPNGCSALRAVVGQRLAHQQIDDETKDQRARHQDEHQERPQTGVHPAAFRVLIYITDHKDENGAAQRYGGVESAERGGRPPRGREHPRARKTGRGSPWEVQKGFA